MIFGGKADLTAANHSYRRIYANGIGIEWHIQPGVAYYEVTRLIEMLWGCAEYRGSMRFRDEDEIDLW